MENVCILSILFSGLDVVQMEMQLDATNLGEAAFSAICNIMRLHRVVEADINAIHDEIVALRNDISHAESLLSVLRSPILLGPSSMQISISRFIVADTLLMSLFGGAGRVPATSPLAEKIAYIIVCF